MPRKRANRSPVDKRLDDGDDDDFFFDDTQSNSGRNSQEPQHRNAANARERARMRVLSKAFCRLKTTLPWVPADTKLSKLDTLRLAASYIAHLRALLHEPRSAHTPPHPLSLSPQAIGMLASISVNELALAFNVAMLPAFWALCLQAWPFAFQHGGSLSCGISQRWNVAPQSEPTRTTREDQNQNQEIYTQYDNEYDERYDNTEQNQYYGYKENYCEMRSYTSDDMMNNV